jgi:hypothetical protein
LGVIFLSSRHLPPGRRDRKKRTLAKFNNEIEDDDEEIKEEEGDTWKYNHCFGKGFGPVREKDQTPRSLTPEVKSRSVSRGSGSVSAAPVQIRGKQVQAEDSVEDEWKCRGEIHTSKRRRCSKCEGWRNGSCKRIGRSPAIAIDEQNGKLSPGIEIGSPKKNRCKLSGCIKCEHGGNGGFCRTHYNLIVRERESMLQKMPSAHWTCECGLEVELSKSRCTCYRWRHVANGRNDVMEEEESVPQDAWPKHKSCGNKCRIPGCNKFKQFNCDDM